MTHLLTGPKNRRYEFTPRKDGVVTVRRWDAGWCVSEATKPVEKARRLYVNLVKLGYEKF